MEEIRNGTYENSQTMRHGNTTEISKTAHRLLSLHGKDAPTVAAKNAADRERAGDVEGRTDWLCVMIRTQTLMLSGQYS